MTGYIISTALPAGLSFSTSTGVISGTPTVTFGSTTYSVIAYNTAGKSNTATVTLSCTQNVVTWKAGSNTTAWETPGNWSTNAVPGVNDAVQIGVAAYTNVKQPTINSNVTVSSITFGSTQQAVFYRSHQTTTTTTHTHTHTHRETH